METNENKNEEYITTKTQEIIDKRQAIIDEEYEKAEKYCKEAEEYSRNLIADFEKMKEIAKSKSSKY